LHSGVTHNLHHAVALLSRHELTVIIDVSAVRASKLQVVRELVVVLAVHPEVLVAFGTIAPNVPLTVEWH
jgi:hypothetical protein